MDDPALKVAGPRDVALAVLSGFFGVRRSVRRAPLRFNPVHLVLTAVGFVVVFVAGLVALVSVIVSSAA